MARHEYSDTAVETTLSSTINASATSISIGSATGWPAGTYPFVIKIEDELILIQSRSGTTLTVASSGRGYSSSTAASHQAGVAALHVWDAAAATDFARHVYDTTANDHTQYQRTSLKGTANGYASLDSNALVPDAQIPSTIARDTEVTSAISAHSADTDPHGDRAAATAALSAHESDTTAVHGIADMTKIWEPGDLKVSARSTAADGWLLCDGTAVSRSTYADLFTAIGVLYGSGNGTSTFNLPDFRDKTIVGVSGTKTRGSTGGAATKTLSISELPSHTHSIDHDHAAATTSTDGTHTHAERTSVFASGGGIAEPYGLTDGSGTTDTIQTGSAGAHSHTVDLAAFTGTSGTAGSGTAFSLLNPYGTANVFIKT